MPEKSSKQSPVFRFLLTFAIVYLLTTTGLRFFFPERFQGEKPPIEAELTLKAERASAPLGRNIFMLLKNTTDHEITLADRCPNSPFDIEQYIGSDLFPVDAGTPVVPCISPPVLVPGTTTKIDLSPWKYAAFDEVGKYKISLPNGGQAVDIVIKEPNMFVSIFRAFISKPILNGLVLIASILPYHSLGGAVILLTLLIKFLLYFPSQHALQSQKKLQTIQPKLDELKRKHEGDQKRLTEETMKLWKEEKINPLESCLPTVVQIPILLGLFFIIRDSGHLDLARHLLYSPFSSLDWTFSTHFLNLIDLARVPFEGIVWWPPSATSLRILASGLPLPFLTACLQFVQMHLAFKKTAALKKKGDEKKDLADALNPQVMMKYMLPIMILFISGGLPAAVSLYWVASTAFAIGQQMIVNRR
jgi:YidC/Oxa1 family membrane protein insertase